MNRYISILLISLIPSIVFGQKLKTVEGVCEYHVPEHLSQKEAKQNALERAKIQAIADEFGTTLTQIDETRISNLNGKSNADYFSIGESEVKGEWIETIGEPKFEYYLDKDGWQIIKVTVKGKVREIVSTPIEIQAKVLKFGKDDKYEADEFKPGDDIFLSFISPVSGYLAVYLVDDDHNAFCLVPDENNKDGIHKVDANQRYVFLDGLYVTCAHPTEHNLIYVVFSPNQFVKAVDNKVKTELPRELTYRNFQKWLAKCRKHDIQMTLRKLPITIQQ